MNIGEAGKLSGLSPDTIRFYEKRGLILSTKRDEKATVIMPKTMWVGWACSPVYVGQVCL